VRPGVDTIIVNYRTPDDLNRCLRAHEDFGVPESDTWVVNVSPEDADLKVDLFWTGNEHPRVHHIIHHANVGYAKAVNHAASLGDREVIAIFNADTALTPDVMSSCLEALQANEDWGVLGPRQVDDAGRITSAGIFGTHQAPAHRGWREANSEKFGDVKEAITVSGSAYFIKRPVWEMLTECPVYKELHPEALGAFLPTQHYYEETWCSYHTYAHSYKVMYFGPACMIHQWHKASRMGVAEQQMKPSQTMFRHACESHGIPHD